jgi:hypothetical protein
VGEVGTSSPLAIFGRLLVTILNNCWLTKSGCGIQNHDPAILRLYKRGWFLNSSWTMPSSSIYDPLEAYCDCLIVF